jgi:hypothetical protein
MKGRESAGFEPLGCGLKVEGRIWLSMKERTGIVEDVETVASV